MYIGFILLLLIRLALDFWDIGAFRCIMRDMLIGNRNQKSEHIIYKEQSLKNKLTLNYIRPYLKKFSKQFDFYHKVYYVNFMVLPLRYTIYIIGYNVLGDKMLFVLMGLVLFNACVFKLVFSLNIFGPRGYCRGSIYAEKKK